jgi:hypothetical protein
MRARLQGATALIWADDKGLRRYSRPVLQLLQDLDNLGDLLPRERRKLPTACAERLPSGLYEPKYY